MKWGLKGGISIDADSGPPRYVLWYCGGICHQVFTFIQIGCGHTVSRILLAELQKFSVLPWRPNLRFYISTWDIYNFACNQKIGCNFLDSLWTGLWKRPHKIWNHSNWRIEECKSSGTESHQIQFEYGSIPAQSTTGLRIHKFGWQ